MGWHRRRACANYAYVAVSLCFFFNDTPTTEIYTLSLHDALPICGVEVRLHRGAALAVDRRPGDGDGPRSEEHTSELQSRVDLVCRLLLEKKKPPHQLPGLRQLDARHYVTRDAVVAFDVARRRLIA